MGNNLIHVKYLDSGDIWRASIALNEHLATRVSQANGLEQPPAYDVHDSDGYYDDDADRVASFLAREMTPSLSDQIRRPAFRHAICVANQSEQAAYQEAVSRSVVAPEGESPEHYVASCKDRHAACNMCGSGPMFLLEKDRHALTVDLNVLGVCRQLYEEANHLLWTTNTFSFEDPQTFSKFFGSLNPAQKRNLTSIHISADIGGLGSYYNISAYQRARWDSDYWGKGLKISNLKMLRGVQTLHLCINQGFQCLTRGYGNQSPEKVIELAQEADMDSILRLRALPLKHATVIVSDDAEKLKHTGGMAHRWTVIKKNEYAERVRVQLADPGGAELVKTEAEVANLERKTEIRDNAATRLKHYKSILKDKRADMVQTAKSARRERAKAVLAAQKANQISNKSSKKAAKLRDAAEKQKRRALHMRGAAEASANKEKYWQEQVDEARKKFQRALARLGATPEDIKDEEEVERLMDGVNGSETEVTEDDDAQADGGVESDEESQVSLPEDEASDHDDDDDEASS